MNVNINTQVKASVKLVIFVVLLVGVAWGGIQFGFNRIYVPVGWSLQLKYNGPPLPFLPGSRPACAPNTFAKVDENGNPLEMGILEEMVGPGRHFYCPLWWKTKLVEDIIVEPGEVGLATSRMGKPLPPGEILVEGGFGTTVHKGDLRKTFGPGAYRINPYAYTFEKQKCIETKSSRSQDSKSKNQVKYSGWLKIPTGYVGVVTNMADNLKTDTIKGLQSKVFQPGIYLLNPRDRQVDVVEIGYRETSIAANQKRDRDGNLVLDESGEPVIADDKSGVGFPSNDGFDINMDFTAIWGVMPEQASDVISNYGNVDVLEDYIRDEIESICLNAGSKLKAVEMLEGKSRLEFQNKISEEFRKVLEAKGATVLNGLVRHIYIPAEVREPIQEANIADELTLTRVQEQKTAETEGSLREAEEKVLLATEQVKIDTDKLVAEKLALGMKTAEETKAETIQKVAAIDKQTAEIEAQATVLLGEAESKAKQMQKEAKADKFKLAVDAFGSGDAYNKWVFASGLPDDIKLNFLYAGEGTFWTDLKGFTETMLGRQTSQSPRQTRTKARPPLR